MKYCSTCNEKYDDSVSFCPKDGEVLEEDPSSLVGTALDAQYQIEAILGKGGMGAVYRARHILLGDRVAIKVLPPEMRSNTEWLRRFQREGQAARRFRHPNAVTVYDLRTSGDGTIYLVMEYVEGNTLDAELRKRGRFSPAEALAVLTPVMSVLNAAHAMGVVHRDLKPENIMIGKATTGNEPVVKLLDLGIAKLREVAGAEKTGTTALTIAGQMLGTPYYMSPEQWGELPRDGNSDIDGRADIYSLGTVFYEVIAGVRPFKGVTLSELRREHVYVTPRSLREIVKTVPAGFSDAIAKSMAKDRDDRQATANDLENELLVSLAAEGITPSATIASLVSSAPADGAAVRGPITAAERTAPTIVGEAASTAAERAAPTPSADHPAEIATMPTLVSGDLEAIDNQAASLPQPAARSRSPLPLIAVAAVVVLLILGVAAFAVIRFMGNKANSNLVASNPAGTTAAAPTHEVGRYWLEVDTKNSSEAIQASDPLMMKSGQSFKFHFSPSENGYLYIIGPGNANAPTTFLTNKPVADSGLKTNEVKSGLAVSFPVDSASQAHWITLDANSGTDEFTIIFSPTQLSAPNFLDQKARHELTQDEQKQLNDLQAQFKANSVGTEVVKNGASPSVAVKVPQTEMEGAPVIFKVRIEHK